MAYGPTRQSRPTDCMSPAPYWNEMESTLRYATHYFLFNNDDAEWFVLGVVS